MAIRPYYTSNTLIEAVKRKMAFPIAQVTYSPEDILRFADEEMMLAQVPSILEYHEEYFVYTKNVQLIPNKSKYPIPNRAIGMKLRDIFYINTQDQICEMTRISPDDKNFFQVSSGATITPVYYYLENNSIVIVPDVVANPVGQIQFSFFLRPNSLVPDEKAAISNSFSKTVTIDNTTLVSGNTLTIDSLVIEAGTNFTIGMTSTATAASLASYINGLNSASLSAQVTSNIVTLIYTERQTSVTTSNATAMAIQSTITVNTSTVPEEITERSIVDILQMDSGHSTLAYDIVLGDDSVSADSITFTEDQLPDDFVVGDYICSQYECIVPQIPTDLHNLLAERTCARIMEAQGDAAGLQAANTKIRELESSQKIVLDTRVDGSPQKILNKTGLLRMGRARFRDRRR